MKKDLLICLAFHYNHPNDERFDYFWKVYENISKNYKGTVDIIIDTNSPYLYHSVKLENVTIFLHENMAHPFHLTMKHREHFAMEIDNYNTFYYSEEDMLLPYENYLSYHEKFKFMYPKYVPSFIRIEYKDGQEYVSDVIKQHNSSDRIIINGRTFFAFPFPENYFACYIATRQSLFENMDKDFTRLHDSREKAASFFVWEKNKTGLVEIELKNGKYVVCENSYVYHLPNNYIDSTMPNAKIKVNEIFI